jgi:SRSO17 transposase
MTKQEITSLGPTFASYLRRFRGSFGQDRTAAHFDTYCRGLLLDLPRKSIEPVALDAGTAVRPLQEFLVTARWDQASARDTLQKHLGAVVADLPGDALGTVEVINETSCRKWGATRRGCSATTWGASGRSTIGMVGLLTSACRVCSGRFGLLGHMSLRHQSATAF